MSKPAGLNTLCVHAAHAPDAATGALQDVRDEARGGGLTVHSGDGHDRNTPILAWSEERSDDRLADWPRLAGRRLQVHPQARGGVDFDDHTALRLERTADVDRDHIDPGNVEADDSCSVDGPRGHIGMN